MGPLVIVTWFIAFLRAFAEFCGEEFDVTNGCNLTYGHTISTVNNVRSITECASWCTLDNRCLTLKYDVANKVCNLNSERYPSLKTNCMLMFKYAWLNKSSFRNFVNNDCKRANDCTVRNSECVSKKCQCAPGYSYNKNNESCVAGCDVYGSTFTGNRDTALFEGDMRTMYNMTKKDVCKRACVEESTFICRSLDIYDKVCYLSHETAFTDPSNLRQISGTTYFDRNCQ